MRNRLKYFILAFLYGYVCAGIAEFLLYGIEIDPFITSLSGFYTIPLAYAIIEYDVFNVNILAKRAFSYALVVTGITLFILFIGYANETVILIIPGFPEWVLPLISSMIAVSVGVFVWRSVKEVDVLKYEFIDVVTHKFRTPITHIKWATELLQGNPTQEDKENALKGIVEANNNLYKLTDMLTGMSKSESSDYLYTFKDESVSDIVDSVLKETEERIKERNVLIMNHISSYTPQILVDRKKFQFTVQMIVDNALTYSPPGGKLEINAKVSNEFVVLSIKDAGMGISKEDMSRLFTKFFRSSDAMHAHTEGLGIGLYLSRDMMRRQGGDLWAESDGKGHGSTFFLKVPIARQQLHALAQK